MNSSRIQNAAYSQTSQLTSQSLSTRNKLLKQKTNVNNLSYFQVSFTIQIWCLNVWHALWLTITDNTYCKLKKTKQRRYAIIFSHYLWINPHIIWHNKIRINNICSKKFLLLVTIVLLLSYSQPFSSWSVLHNTRLDPPRCKQHKIRRKELPINNLHYITNDNLLPRNIIPVTVTQN